MEWYEAAFDHYYPILYSHRDDKEAARALDTFGHYLDGDPILDLASGDGRYLDVLLKDGREVWGVDLSGYLLGRSVERPGHSGRLVQADMRTLPFRDDTFGGVINMFTSFGYFSVDTDNLLVFREVHRVLRSSGTFLFDFINAERISSSLLQNTERETDAYHISEKRHIADHGKYLVKAVDLTNTQTDERESFEERLRLYTRDDLVKMFKSTRMQVVDVFGDYEGNPFAGSVSERVIMIARKP